MQKFEWDDIYLFWKAFSKDLAIPTDRIAAFQDVYAERLPYDLVDVGLDWWPKKYFEERSASLLKSCEYVYFWETYRGTLHTASELYKSQDNAEQQAAVWMMASIWDKEHKLPESWRGDTFGLLGSLFRVIREAFPDISVWHHASRRALPVTIGPYYPACDFIHPHDYTDLIYLSLLEAAIVLPNWQLVKFVPPEDS